MTRVLDSNILIDALGGHQAARHELLEEEDTRISRISWMEVLVGCKTAEEEGLAREMLQTLRMVDLSQGIAEAAVMLRRERRLKLPDAVVLATARVSGCQLVTRNTKDFAADDPEIRVPYRL